MNNKGIQITALSILSAIFLLTACGSEKQDPLSPLPLSMFQWGSSHEAVKALYSKDEWTMSKNEPEELQFQIRYSADAGKSGLMKDLSYEPHTVSYFFNDGKMAIVRIIRKDSPEKLKEYYNKVKEIYNLRDPVWNSGEKIYAGKSETEGEIKESVSVYESGDLIVKTVYSVIRAETIPEIIKGKIKSDFSDRFEIMIYSKRINPGLTAEALIESEK